MKDIAKLFKFLFSTHFKIIWPCAGIYIFCVTMFFLRWFSWRAGHASYFYGSAAYEFGVIGITLISFGLSFYLGSIFNLRRSQNIISQLPFASQTLELAGPILLVINGLITFVAIYPTWHYAFLHLAQTTVYLLFLQPFLVYYIARRIKSTWIALLAASFVIFGGLVVIEYLEILIISERWFVEEVLFSVLLMFFVLTFENKRWRVPVFYLVALLLYLGLGFSTVYLIEPQTFRGTILKLKFFPTEKAVTAYKRFATHPDLWSRENTKPVDLLIYSESARFAESYLNIEEKLLLLKGIIEHHQLFESQTSPQNVITFYPLRGASVGLEGQRWLLNYFDLKPAFCDLMPPIVNREALEALQKSRCEKEPYRQFWEQYMPLRKSESDHLWEAFLLQAHDRGSTDNKVALSSEITSLAGWDKETSPHFKEFSGPWLMKRPFTLQELEDWKKAFRLEVRKKIAAMSGFSSEKLLGQMVAFPDWDPVTRISRTEVLQYLCNRLSDNCHSKYQDFATDFYFNPTQFWLKLRLFFNSDRYNFNPEDVRYITEILKPENISKLRGLSQEGIF